MFRKTVIGQARHEMLIVAWNVDVSLKIHVNIGFVGQKNTSNARLESSVTKSLLFEAMVRPNHMTEYRNRLLTEIIYHEGHHLDSSSCEEQVFARLLESSALPNEAVFSLSRCFQVIFPQEKPMKKRCYKCRLNRIDFKNTCVSE